MSTNTILGLPWILSLLKGQLIPAGRSATGHDWIQSFVHLEGEVGNFQLQIVVKVTFGVLSNIFFGEYCTMHGRKDRRFIHESFAVRFERDV